METSDDLQRNRLRWLRELGRRIRFHVDRTGTCRTLLCRVPRYLLNTAFIVCLMGHTAVQSSVEQGFLAAQAILFHVLMPIETSRNVNLYNASQLRFSTFVHDLMNLQAPEGQSVSLCDRPATGHRDVVFLQRPARLGEVLTVFAQRHGRPFKGEHQRCRTVRSGRVRCWQSHAGRELPQQEGRRP